MVYRLLSLLPWVFYAFERPRRFSVWQPLILAVFVLTHNLLALIGAALLALYLLWRGLLIDGPRRWGYDLFSIGLALALTAVFWLPFIAERNAIRLDVAGPGHFDYHNHFIPLSMLLSPSPALDMGATTPKYIYNLGLVQWLLLIPAAILAVLRRKSTSGKIALFFVLTTLLVLFLITPQAAFLWDLVPPAAFVQFPWRMLAAFDVYALPSLWEGHSISLLEAVAAGKAVVATDIEGNRETIEHGISGLLVPPADPAALAEGVRTLLADRALAKQMGESALRTARDRFSQERMVEQNVQVYDSGVSGKLHRSVQGRQQALSGAARGG